MNLSKNNTGSNKSAVQVIGELLTAKNSFFKELGVLVEHFHIQGNVFGWNGSVCTEMSQGYYGELKEADTLEALYDDFNVLENCIYIKDNKFHLGKWYPRMNEVQESFVIDLKNSTVINA